MRANAPKLVFDTNVLVSAAMGSTRALSLLQQVEAGNVRLIISPKLWLEFTDVTQRDRVRPLLQTTALIATNRILIKHAELRRDPQLRNPIPLSSDRDDDYVLALARSTGAAVVTGDAALAATGPADIPVISIAATDEALNSPEGLHVGLARSL